MTDRANADSRLREQLIATFEQNFLDGDKIQEGQMIASSQVVEFIDDFVLPVCQEIAREARQNSEHYWIKYYGDQRKFLDGSDGDIPAIRELDRHQQLHKDRLSELTQKLAEEQTIDAKTQALINDNLFNLFED